MLSSSDSFAPSPSVPSTDHHESDGVRRPSMVFEEERSSARNIGEWFFNRWSCLSDNDIEAVRTRLWAGHRKQGSIWMGK